MATLVPQEDQRGMGRLVFRRSRLLEEALRLLTKSLGLDYIDIDRVYGAVSLGSRSRAYARIWGVPSPFTGLGLCKPMYVVEVLYENTRGLSCGELLEVLLHELLHIPRSFSGGLRSHGEWSRRSSLRRLLSRLRPEDRERICSLARRALEEASGP